MRLSSQVLDRIAVSFDDKHAVAAAGLILPATVSRKLGLVSGASGVAAACAASTTACDTAFPPPITMIPSTVPSVPSTTPSGTFGALGGWRFTTDAERVGADQACPPKVVAVTWRTRRRSTTPVRPRIPVRTLGGSPIGVAVPRRRPRRRRFHRTRQQPPRPGCSAA